LGSNYLPDKRGDALQCQPLIPYDPQAVQEFLASFLAIGVSSLGNFINQPFLIGRLRRDVCENFGFFRGDYLAATTGNQGEAILGILRRFRLQYGFYRS
jgi:hypothetical protein